MASQKKKNALYLQIRNVKILGSMRDLSPADSMQKMHRVIAEFVVPRLEMFSQSFVIVKANLALGSFRSTTIRVAP